MGACHAELDEAKRGRSEVDGVPVDVRFVDSGEALETLEAR